MASGYPSAHLLHKDETSCRESVTIDSFPLPTLAGHAIPRAFSGSLTTHNQWF